MLSVVNRMILGPQTSGSQKNTGSSRSALSVGEKQRTAGLWGALSTSTHLIRSQAVLLVSIAQRTEHWWLSWTQMSSGLMLFNCR